MSVQVSYKKQTLLGVLLLLILFLSIELIMKTYDFFQPNCIFMESQTHINLDAEQKRKICHDNTNLLWMTNPLRLLNNH